MVAGSAGAKKGLEVFKLRSEVYLFTDHPKKPKVKNDQIVDRPVGTMVRAEIFILRWPYYNTFSIL